MHPEPPTGRRDWQAGGRWALQQDSPPAGRNEHATEKQGALVRQGGPLPAPGSRLRELEGFSRERPSGATGDLGRGGGPSGEQHDSALCFSPTKRDEQIGTSHWQRTCLWVTAAVKSRTETCDVRVWSPDRSTQPHPLTPAHSAHCTFTLTRQA